MLQYKMDKVYKMSEEGPNNKAEILEIFRRLRQTPANRQCFDCGAKAPTWASVTYGVFICIDCSAVHRSLGVHLSFVRSTQLDTNWTWTQLRCMQLGGNANAQAFFSQHHCSTSDSQQKYNSRAAQLYREKLSQLVSKHIKLHGVKIVFETDEPVEQPAEDFFDHIKKAEGGVQTLTISHEACLFDMPSQNDTSKADQSPGPSVDAITSPTGSVTTVAAPRKSTIGAKRPANKLGAKKLGMGAQKVKADFSAIEKEAEMLDEMKEQKEAQAKVEASKRTEEEERHKASMSLTYQEISKQQKKREELLKYADPKKAEQVERLGMGVGVRAGVSHSVLSEMQTIEQENPSSGSSKNKSKFDSFFDDFEIVDSPSDRASFMTAMDSFSKSSDFDFDRPSKPKMEEDEFLVAMKSTSRPKTREPSSSSAVSNEAQKKFGNAKAISSDQMFGDSRDNDYERRSNLSRFEGKSSISSSEYFGTGEPRATADGASTLQALQNVDLDDVRESLRQGVNKVGAKLVTLTNGMMSSLQEKYGY